MKIEIKKTLMEEGIVDHVKNNWGKYAGGVGAAGLGATYAAGQGLLGVDAQDAVHDSGANLIMGLKTGAAHDETEADVSSTIDVLKRPDNILGPNKLSDTIDYQHNIEPGTYTSPIKDAAGNAVAKLTGLDSANEQINYGIRNPMDAGKLAGRYSVGHLTGAIDGLRK